MPGQRNAERAERAPQSAVGTGTSRAGAARQATRKPLKARVSISGAAGAGKTWSALQIATVLAADLPGGVTWIDTEATTEDAASSETYADAFDFDVINWQRSWGYDPRDLIATLWDLARRGADMPAVVGIDSASHFWRGPGGTLDIADGRYTGWRGARPVQDSLVETILQLPYHVIVCTRAKMAHEVDESSGKQVVSKLGMAPIQSDDLEYEMQVALSIDMDHRIDVSKTRATVLSGKSWQANHEIDLALLYRDWLAKGEAVIRQRDVDALVSVIYALPEGAPRSEYREAFKSTWGGTGAIAPDQLDDVWRWVFAAVEVDPHPFSSAGDEAPDWCQTCRARSACRWHRSDAPDPIERDADQPNAQNGSDGSEPPAGTETADEQPSPASDDPGAPGEQPAAESPDDSSDDEAARLGAVVEPDDVPRGTTDEPVETPEPEDRDELADRLAAERQIAQEVQQMTITAVKQQLAARRQRVTGSEANLRAALVREISISRLGEDPFVVR